LIINKKSLYILLIQLLIVEYKNKKSTEETKKMKQKITSIDFLNDEDLAYTLFKMLIKKYLGISIKQLEQEITDEFSPGKNPDKELLFTDNVRVAFAAGWIFEFENIKYFALFSRDSKMYIGDKYQSNSDIEVNLSKIDVITASRVVWPNGGYSTGGKIEALRENEKFSNTKINSLEFAQENIVYERNTETGEESYMVVGVLDFGNIDEYLFHLITTDENIVISKQENAGIFDKTNLSAKSKLFLRMISWFFLITVKIGWKPYLYFF